MKAPIKKKLNKFSLINDGDIDETFQDDSISLETINKSAKRIKKDNQIIPSVNYNGFEADTCHV